MLRIKLSLAVGLLAAAACAAPPQKVDFSVLDQDIPIDQIHIPATSTPLPEAVTLSLADARAAVPFAVGLPAWAPDGFQLLDAVEVTADPASASVALAWQNADGAAIDLTLSNNPAGAGRLAGAGSVEAVTINGQPASVRHTTGLGASRLVLTWTRDGVAYRLAAPADALDTASLVRMAESIPK
jgi:hypothetical protein